MVRNLGELGIDLQKIVSRLMANQNLVKLLYYTDKDPYNHKDLTDTQIKAYVYNKLIRVIPRVGPKETANSIIAIKVVSANTNPQNNQFRDILINIEVFVPLTQWMIKDSNLRPFAIMGEVHKTLSNKTIDGLGKIIGGDFAVNFFTEEISAYEMSYIITNYD